jgi:1-acyl-sn-glycerol-3-phosphate acyltransferase
MMVSPLHPCYAAKAEIKNLPIIGVACEAMQCIFIDRGGTEEQRNKIVETIMAR